MRPGKEYEIAMLLVTKGAEGWWSVIEDKFTILLECLWIVSIARGGRCVRCRVTHRSVLYGIIYR